MTATKNTSIQEISFKRALAILDSLKCSYAIIDFDGIEHGTLEIIHPSDSKKTRAHPHGERSSYVREFLKMDIGDVRVIPSGKYDVVQIQASTVSAAHRDWGPGSVTTAINRQKNHVEVLRIL